MIIRGSEVLEAAGRKSYPIGQEQGILHHLAAYTTTPENPFRPHKHERAEIWYIVDGQALVSLDGYEEAVVAGDVVVLAPWVEHGLRSESRARWLCLG